jgi:hypothetical protein
MVARRESLLTASAVKLYGRVIRGLNIDVDDARNELGANRFLREQLEADSDSDGKYAPPRLARIYGFSYFGRYTALSRPAIFLIHGKGHPAAPRATAVVQNVEEQPGTLAIDPKPGPEAEDKPELPFERADFRDPDTSARYATGPNSVDFSGQAVKCCEFSSDIRVWEYDRGDFSLRLDIDSGPLERILIDREEAGDEMPYFRGAKTRLRTPGD